MIKFWKNGRMNWPVVKAFGEYCLENAVKSDDTEGMQVFKTVVEVANNHPMMMKNADLEIARLIVLKTQEHEFEISKAVAFGKSYDSDSYPVCMDGVIEQIGSDDFDTAMREGFCLEYVRLKDIYDRVGYYDEFNSFVADPAGDFRRIDIVSSCRLVKDADSSEA